jgi:hypothetical protein
MDVSGFGLQLNDPDADATTKTQPLLAAAYLDAMLRRVEEEI